MIFRNLPASMLRRVRTVIVDCGGNVAVEFVLVAPIFIMMLIGLADYGLAARERSSLDAAARAGLQVLFNNPADTAGAEALAETLVPPALAEATLVCTCSDGSAVSCASGSCGYGAPRRVVSVTLTESYPLLFSWPGFANPQPLTATALGRIR